ncbi:MAG TPA: hypothetical protein PL073_08795 [Spirochaetota bacterium]|nr:hypothetical protein [Spirochaetota bacterium]
MTRHSLVIKAGEEARYGKDISIAIPKAFFFAYFLLPPNKRKYEKEI